MNLTPIKPPICTCRPRMEPDPAGILALLNHSHRGYKTVRYLVDMHPAPAHRNMLRLAAGITGREPRHYAAFEWHLLRINDTLPLTGWMIEDENERYRLRPISEAHFMRLVNAFNRRMEHAGGT